MHEDLGERTEEATPRRLQEAREEGNVARSADMAGALLLLAITALLWMGLMPALGGLKVCIEAAIGTDTSDDLVRTGAIESVIREGFGYAVRVGLPILALAWLAAYLSHFLQIGWLFTARPLRPNLGKLNPVAGFKRNFGLRAGVKAGLDGSKVLIVFAVAGLTVIEKLDQIVFLPHLDLMPALAKTGWLLFDLALRILAVLIALGVLDLLWQKWKHRRDLRMTRIEVREELKQTEGDPETKRRRLRMQQQIAMQRLNVAVPKADVIVTNPEHISIAIQYDEKTMRAPKVVAKGADFLAFRIRHLAIQHGIPVVERKPLARALYRSVEVGREIPPDFYQAVAEILAYVYRLSRKS